MKHAIIVAIMAGAAALPALAAEQQTAGPKSPVRPGQMVLFEESNYNGDDLVIQGNRASIDMVWNIRSIAIHEGEKWQICAARRFRDPCIIIDRSIPDAKQIGIEGGIGSARPAPAGERG